MKNIKWTLLFAVIILGGFRINIYYNSGSKKSSAEWISNEGETLSPTPHYL